MHRTRRIGQLGDFVFLGHFNQPMGPNMWDTRSTIDTDLSYAIRRVRSGGFTAEQAAALCGVSLQTLEARLACCTLNGTKNTTPVALAA